jgi:MYXO-CTERM domain-containing protein
MDNGGQSAGGAASQSSGGAAGSGGNGAGGLSGHGGTAGVEEATTGCKCSLGGRPDVPALMFPAAAGLALLLVRRRRRTR